MSERIPLPVLGVIAAGGMLGALGRYGLATAMPTSHGRLPVATMLTNVSGCLLIGVLMVFVTGTRTGAHPLLRPFLGVGVLGGYTTFSTYAVETQRLLTEGRAVLGLVYLVGTLVAALVAVAVGSALGTAGLRLVGRRGGGDVQTERVEPVASWVAR